MVSGPELTNNTIKKDKLNSALVSSEGLDKQLDSDSKKHLAHELMKESDAYSASSEEKAAQAQEYLKAAEGLEKMAKAVRAKANLMRNAEVDEIKKKEIVDQVSQIAGNVLEFPVPKNADADLLDQIADTIEKKAKDNRLKADSLLKDSESDERLSKSLREQSEKVSKKDGVFGTDLSVKSFEAHRDGLSKVVKMLGIQRLDNMLKDQVAAAEKKINS